MDFLTPIKVKEYSGQPVTIAQVKFNGYYAEVYKSRSIVGNKNIMFVDQQVFICTKKQEKNLWDKLWVIPQIRKQIDSLPYETILRCELHAPGVPATSVPTMINDADERLLLSPFCIELWGGHKPICTYQFSNDLLIKSGFIVPYIINPYSFDESVVIEQPLNDAQVKALKVRAIEEGLEGYVVKDLAGNCYKIKPQKTVDAFVVGYTISDSDTYAGGLKSVDVAVFRWLLEYGKRGKWEEIIIATVGTGFEGDYRMSVDPKSLIGRVGEFKYQNVGAKGRLIFPRFLRWRDDEKNKNDCFISQLKGI